jgi:hypothetical protein
VEKVVREQENEIEGTRKAMASKYKDLNTKTLREEKFEEYKANQMSAHHSALNIDNMVITRDGSIAPSGSADPRLLEELDELKINEKEAREHVLRL